jgi:hypothetical protein
VLRGLAPTSSTELSLRMMVSHRRTVWSLRPVRVASSARDRSSPRAASRAARRFARAAVPLVREPSRGDSRYCAHRRVPVWVTSSRATRSCSSAVATRESRRPSRSGRRGCPKTSSSRRRASATHWLSLSPRSPRAVIHLTVSSERRVWFGKAAMKDEIDHRTGAGSCPR